MLSTKEGLSSVALLATRPIRRFTPFILRGSLPFNPTVKSPVLTLQQFVQRLNVYSPPLNLPRRGPGVQPTKAGWRPVKLRRTLFA